MKIIIVGAMEATKALANLLSSEKHKVTIVEKDTESAKKIESEVEALVINGDATDVSILKDAGISEAQAIIICSKDDKANLMIAEIAKEIKVDEIIVVVNSPKNVELFENLDISKTISVVDETITMIKGILAQKGNHKLVTQMDEGKVQIIEAKVCEKSRLDGKPVASVKDAIISAIYRSGRVFLPGSSQILKSGDIITVTVKSASKE